MGDEKYVYYCKPDASKQCLGTHQPAKVIIKKSVRPKVMLSVWMDYEGVIHWQFVPNGRAVDEDLYSQQLERVNEILRRRYPPALVSRKRALL